MGEEAKCIAKLTLALVSRNISMDSSLILYCVASFLMLDEVEPWEFGHI